MNKPLISEEYRKQNAKLHSNTKVKYGARGHRHLDTIGFLMNLAKPLVSPRVKFTRPKILDYGAGKGQLEKAILKRFALKIRSYDPAVKKFSRHPHQDKEADFDLVVCTDVLEHIEPEFLDNVLEDIFTLGKSIYLFIATWPDRSKTLPDGTNPHKSLHSYSEWVEIIKAKSTQHGFKYQLLDPPSNEELSLSKQEKQPFIVFLEKN